MTSASIRVWSVVSSTSPRCTENGAANGDSGMPGTVSGRTFAPGGFKTHGAVDDFLFRFLGAYPTAEADPLAGFEILVVLEEVRDLRELNLRQTARRLARCIDGREVCD